MKKTAFLAFVLLLSMIVYARSGSGPQKVLRVSDGKVVAFDQMIDDLKNASLVFVGEIHDIPEHHQAQLDIIKAVHQADREPAIGLEMFRAENQAVLTSWSQGKMPLKEFLVSYYDNWRMPWPLYRDIFEYAREHEVPLRGLNIPEGISRKIAERGFSSLTADERKQLPPGISCNVDPAYMEFIKRAYSGHSGHQDKNFVNFCEAQMVWDKAMAWHAVGYLKKNPDRSMVILAGIGHAWKRGIAEQLEGNGKYTFRVVLPAIPGQVDRGNVTAEDADYLLLE